MITLLKKAVAIKMISPIDFYFSQFVTKTNYTVMLIAACVSYENRNGQFFLPIQYFENKYFFSSSNKPFIKKILLILKNNLNWSSELLNHSAVSNGSIITPLVLDHNKIYLYKMWKAEKNIFNMLNSNNQTKKINLKKCAVIINNLFPEKRKNFQKIAVALTLINNITFIIGAPGTGKTTTILKIIIALIKNTIKPIKIQLSAPTGKSATHLLNILNNNIFNEYLTEKERFYLPKNVVTIHQLLGIKKISQKSFFNENRLLNTDVLIIDETSMIDILIMEKVFLSVSKKTKLIFIGDQNQLSPIDTGSILKYISNYAVNEYNSKTLSYIKKLTHYKVSNKKNNKIINFISNKICMLKKTYRFDKNSGIYELSNAIFYNKKNIIQKLFKNSIKNVFFYEVNSTELYVMMIEKITSYYKDFWKKIRKKATIKEIIETFQQHQVLCVLRHSLFGVNTINKKLEENMYKKNIIQFHYVNNKIWYIGKPIIITVNNKYLDLYNGNIGIANINKNSIWQVSFLKKNNTIQNIPINILKNYHTSFAITVHKAQGSEFINTSLILPNFDSPILNKDTLYTGITRSKKTLNIFSNRDIFINSFFKKNSLYNIM